MNFSCFPPSLLYRNGAHCLYLFLCWEVSLFTVLLVLLHRGAQFVNTALSLSLSFSLSLSLCVYVRERDRQRQRQRDRDRETERQREEGDNFCGFGSLPIYYGPIEWFKQRFKVIVVGCSMR